jgi:hypothetical protein
MLRVGQMYAPVTDHIRSVFFKAGYAIRDDGGIFDMMARVPVESGPHPRDQFWRWVRLMQEKGYFERVDNGGVFTDDDTQSIAPGA